MKAVKIFSVAIASAGFLLLATAVEVKAVSLKYNTSIGRPANLAQGELPGTPGTLATPQGVAVQESTGNIFVANGRGIDRIDVFSSSGNYLKGIGGTGSGPGQFDEPAAIAFQPGTGNLYAGDVFNNRINVFNSKGNYLKSIVEGQFGGLIEGRLFFGPSSIVFDKGGNGYVGDFSNDRIIKINPDGEIIGSIGNSGNQLGQFQGPAGIAISPGSGNFVVTDQFNNRVQILNSEAKPIKTFGEAGSKPGQFNQPVDVEVDKFDNIYVMDLINSRVQVFDKDGNFLSEYGKAAAGRPPQLGEQSPYGDPLDLTPGTFNWTAGSDYKNGKLYVGDFFQGRIQVLDVNNTQSTPVPEPDYSLGLAVLGTAVAVAKWRKNQKQKLIESLEKRLGKSPDTEQQMEKTLY
ncbi:scytonemin biosynthesis PEP-CTERM protein ScyF [uncultured Nostoc sp.]|uniref:scytonemin biosynthesis PEP-CTERM protein ScyF n=1 Tax=uncultured Nostoc sp. TaxID=340711 RepID=UPI0035CA18AD